MNRGSYLLGTSVFVYSMITELLCIRIVRGSLAEWLAHPHRELLLL